MAAYTTIDDSEAYFQTKLYTGNGTAIGSGGLAVTLDGDTDMQPDLIWVKERENSVNHQLYDSVRGVTNRMYPDGPYDEDDSDGEGITAFNSDGFTIGQDSNTNESGEPYVAWCWKESATAGFDLVGYTGNGTDDTDISHNLSAVPHVILVKRRDGGDGGAWNMYHHKNTSAPETDYLVLDTTAATADAADRWSDEAPTSSIFTLGTSSDVNDSSDAFISYLWTAKQGFSKFGSYIGNGNADGTFVYTGFRPAFVMTKQTDGTDWWVINDTKRNTYNATDLGIYPNATNAETSDEAWTKDILSNGFKHRTTNSGSNGSGNTYIYMAFAEAPFVNSNGVPCNAR
jgi:hypothetical protein